MKKTHFALIGTGWRSQFFVRIAKEIPSQFELTAMLCRDKEKGEKLAQKLDIKVVNDLDVLLEDKPDFVVLCIAKAAAPDYLIKLFEMGIPVLCETPPAIDKEDLYKIWDSYTKTNAKVQIAEQYSFWPLYSAWQKVIDEGKLGTVSNMSLSAVHGYHAVSLFRQFLNAGMDKVTISGRRFHFNAQQTDSRDAIIKNGDIQTFNRDLLTFEFDNGNVGFFDFSPVQYHSYIRTRRLNIQGERGEIEGMDIRYINDDGDGVSASLIRNDLGVYNNNNWSHLNILLNGNVVYENPFKNVRLNDDEIAVAMCLYKMKEYLDNGKDFYSLKDGLQDAIISLAMEEALQSEKPVTVEKQIWA